MKNYRNLIVLLRGLGEVELSLLAFSLFINDLIIKVIASSKGCHLELTGVNIILYADDILLFAPFITALQSLLPACEDELLNLDMMIKKKNPIVFVSVIRH